MVLFMINRINQSNKVDVNFFWCFNPGAIRFVPVYLSGCCFNS